MEAMHLLSGLMEKYRESKVAKSRNPGRFFASLDDVLPVGSEVRTRARREGLDGQDLTSLEGLGSRRCRSRAVKGRWSTKGRALLLIQGCGFLEVTIHCRSQQMLAKVVSIEGVSS
ncbi:hypothetical protein KFK09_000599 [Dendrobium nobile]|uniref:Uncharacterized protein n=1 Tax=Dendrobium nobile TaxID=94219 RepID=A0A8T3CED9_DENNO|nr:hypothetical protein KFK09_000599 [Dendrobium nobile]